MASLRTRSVGLALTFLLACTPRQPGLPAASPSRPNLLLVTLDTTRADRLGCYGSSQAETPRLDRLAREGALVEQAIAPAPTTLPSHASLLTGLYPPRHGARDNSDFRLPPSERTLAEHLRERGYRTAAIIGSVVLAADRGLAQGFELYDEPRPPDPNGATGKRLAFSSIAERRASAVTDQAFAALEAFGGEPFFLWVHYFDPHADYTPPAPYAERFAGRPYDGEIAYADAELGRLLDELARRNMLDRTLVVVAADHGESLGEHGEETHGIFLYDSTLRVPLIFRLKGAVASSGRIGRLVSLVDVAPTALDLMGLAPMAGLHGESFAAALRGGTLPPRDPVYAEAIYPERAYGWASTFALRDLETKFIEAPELELYDLLLDPGELRNLAPSRAHDVDARRVRLSAEMRRFGEAGPEASHPMETETRQRLASLGYVSGTAPQHPGRVRPDPKRRVAEHNAYLLARSLIRRGRLEEAERALRAASEADPANPVVLMLRGAVLFSLGRRDEGLARLEAATRLAPAVAEIQWTRAQALHSAGRLAKAASGYRLFLALEPESVRAHSALGDVLSALGDPGGAAREYEEAIRLGFDAPLVRAALGAALAEAGRLDAADSALRAAVREDPSLAAAWHKLGVLAEKRGREEEALGHYARALEVEPESQDARFNHARLSLSRGDRETARREVARLLAAHPGHPATRYLEALLLAAEGDFEGARESLRAFLAQPGPRDPRLAQSARELLRKLGVPGRHP